jgi:hypothetical protein
MPILDVHENKRIEPCSRSHVRQAPSSSRCGEKRAVELTPEVLGPRDVHDHYVVEGPGDGYHGMEADCSREALTETRLVGNE